MKDGSMASCEIFSEDAYGPEFFMRLVKKLKEESGLDESLSVATKRLPGICYPKSERAIKAASMSFDRILIVVDAEGPANKNTIFEKVNSHIRREIKSKADIVILDYMIEEWICYSLRINFGSDKPSKVLNDWCKNRRGTKRGYKKWQLPNFVVDLDIGVLMQKPSFRNFIDALRR